MSWYGLEMMEGAPEWVCGGGDYPVCEYCGEDLELGADGEMYCEHCDKDNQ